MTHEADARLADLEYVVRRVEEVHERLLAEAKAPQDAAAWTPEQEARWTGSFWAVHAILADLLWPCREAWREGAAYSRAGDRLLAGAKEEDP